MYSYDDIARLLVKTFNVRANASSITRAKDFKRNSKYCFKTDEELIVGLAEAVDDTAVLSFVSTMDIVYRKANALVFHPDIQDSTVAELKAELRELTKLSSDILDRLNSINDRLDRLE